MGDDPVGFVHRFEDPRDREVAGILASCLAYGRVRGIRRDLDRLFAILGPPWEAVVERTWEDRREMLGRFRHRFTGGGEVVALLDSLGRVLAHFGSLKACFMEGLSPAAASTVEALGRFARMLDPRGRVPSLVPDPARGSACKRLHLFLRWMVRRDEVDPGGWEEVGAWRLVVPLDTHMFRLARGMGLTSRRVADLRAALEITEGFRALRPDDPVRYDFALARVGMEGQAEWFLSEWERAIGLPGE